MTENQDRREFLRSLARNTMLGALALFSGTLLRRTWHAMSLKKDNAQWRTMSGNTVWQIDPRKCVQCGQCATHCVLSPSAVKCAHNFSVCGYCKLCFGYFQPGAPALTSDAENQLCPTGAIKRRFVESPFYEYSIDEALCIGCGKCVKGCNTFGNGSLSLQIRHDRCLNCNECAIARNCPAGAVRRIPAQQTRANVQRRPGEGETSTALRNSSQPARTGKGGSA